MSKSQIRSDKTCLNCNFVVEKRFCGNCGQENTDTRKTFHHLFIHFFEDLTHYENSFWKTIRNLLFNPAALSKEYLSGKRMSYLAPVRLYIFISFITFFLFAIIPSNEQKSIIKINTSNSNSTEEPHLSNDEKKLNELLQKSKLSLTEQDRIRQLTTEKHNSFREVNVFGYKSVEEFDSIQKFGKEDDKIPKYLHKYVKNSITNTQKYTVEELKEKVEESILHNFPKVLLIYMPFFAFFLWLFHDKKKWYYFDHGIFTLHYFSFLLLISLLSFLISSSIEILSSNEIVGAAASLVSIVGVGWMIYYFFPAHHRFYGETLLRSFVKGTILMLINFIFISLLFLLLFIYSFITIH